MRVQVTVVDEKLPHQIVLGFGPNAGSGYVSCNCLQLTSYGGHKPMGTVRYGDLDAAWALYDNPDNHRSNGVPAFVRGERPPKEWATIW